MKTKYILAFLFAYFSFFTVNAQKITIGIENGINFSNLYGDFYDGKWDSQPGPVSGIFSQYRISNWFALQTGMSFTSQYYNYLSEQYYHFNDFYPSSDFYLSSSLAQSAIYQPSYYSSNFWKFSFIRIPLLLQFKTPGKLNFEMGTGPYYSFFVNDEFTGKDKKRYQEIYGDEDKYPSTDWGWIFTAGLNYSLTDHLEIKLSGRTTIGKEVYINSVEGRNGSAEILFGIGYKLFANKEKQVSTKIKSDSLLSRIEMMPHTGIIFGISSNPDFKDNYLTSLGYTAGISVKYLQGKHLSLISGMWYERKGYGLSYNGEINHIYLKPKNDNTSSFVNTEVNFDYLTFPFLIDFRFGNRFIWSFNFGFYYSLMQNAMVRGDYIYTNSSDNYYSVQKKYIYDKVNGRFNNDDIGGIVGLGFEFPVFSKSKIFIGMNYSHGFQNIFKYEYADNPLFGWDQKIFNASYSIDFGFVFPIYKTQLP